MSLDLRTLAIVIGITSTIQVLALSLQYLVNKGYRGIGWWVSGYALAAAGFSLLILRDVVSVSWITIVLPNAFLVLGAIFIYLGTTRFSGQEWHGKIVLSVFVAFLLSFLYYTYINDDIRARTVVVTAASAVISFMTAYGLSRFRPAYASVCFTSAIFLVFGCFSAFRALVTPTLTPVSSLFTPTMMQTAGLLVPLVLGILGALGLIIMVNQRSNAEMKEAKERFEAIFNTSPDAAAIARVNDAVLVDVNERFTEISGFSRDELIGRSGLDLGIWINPSDRQNVIAEIKEKGSCREYEATFRIKSGSWLTAIMSARVILLEGVPHIISVTHDISERKRAEEALLESERLFSDLFHHAPSAMVLARLPEGVIVDVNQAWVEMYGYTREEAVGKTTCALGIHRDSERRKRFFAEMQQRGFARNKEATFYTKSGAERMIHSNIDLVTLKGEKYLLSSMLDITERKQIEDALRESRERYRELVESSNSIVMRADKNLNVTYMNDFGLKFFGYTAQELQGKNVVGTTVPLTDDDGRDLAAMAKEIARRPSNFKTNVHQNMRKNGELVWVSWTNYVKQNPDGGAEEILAIGNDISELKKTEEALRRSEQRYRSLHAELEVRVRERTAELERRNQELQEFAFIASHDLSEPLRKIQTFGTLLQERCNDLLGEQERDFISRMTGSADRMQELLNALLAYSRVDAKGQEFRVAKLDDIMKAAVSDLEVAVGKIGARIEIGPLPSVTGDPSQLRQLFQNLIANSLKYYRSEVTPLVRIEGEENNGACRILVEDHGIGFDERYLEKIFQPFQRLHGRNEYSGTGMGLAICRKIVQRHHGTITAKSTPGKGSTFIVTLPADPAKTSS